MAGGIGIPIVRTKKVEEIFIDQPNLCEKSDAASLFVTSLHFSFRLITEQGKQKTMSSRIYPEWMDMPLTDLVTRGMVVEVDDGELIRYHLSTQGAAMGKDVMEKLYRGKCTKNQSI
jgi:hypothetical protein